MKNRAASALAPAVIGFLPRLFINLAPNGERQSFPFGGREDVSKLRHANFVEVLIDPACQVGCFTCLLGCHAVLFSK